MLLGIALLLAASVSFAQAPEDLRTSGRPMTASGSPPALEILNPLVPAEGSQAAFLITETATVQLIDRSGIFSLVDMDQLHLADNLNRMIRVHYTVLAADEQTGHPRLLVRAQPLEFSSGQPASASRWEVIYRISPTGALLESEEAPPEEYADSVRPDWLSDWLFTPAENVPRDLQPGVQWTARADMKDMEDLPFVDLDEVSFPVTGQFVGWVDVPGFAQPAAQIHETVSGQISMQETFEEGLEGAITFGLDGRQDYWLIPDDFPYGIDQTLHGVISIQLSESAQQLGLSGGLGIGFEFHRVIQRDAQNSDIWLPVAEPVEQGSEGDTQEFTMLHPGEPVFGTLGEHSHHLDDDTPVDYYMFSGVRGQKARILLESDDFDAYLFLKNDRDETLAEDDDSAGGTNAVIEYLLPYTGPYRVLANTYSSGEAGHYTLTLQLTDPLAPEDMDWGRVHYMVARLQTPSTLTAEELDETERILHQLLELIQQERLNR